MNTDELKAVWEQLTQNSEAVWTQALERFNTMSTRIDTSDASMELTILLAGAFILGFLFCAVQGKKR